MRCRVTKARILKLISKTPWLLLFISLGGWMLFVIGFGLTNHDPQLLDWLGNQFEGRTQNLFFSFWVCCFVGGALYIAAYLHLMFRRWFTSLALHVLTALYLISSGAVIMTEIILNNLTLSFLKQTQPLWSYVQMEMAGCVISFLSLAMLMSLWPLMSVRPLPPFLRSQSINQSHSHVPLIESGVQGGNREAATAHKFATTNTSAAPPTEEGKAPVTVVTQLEKKALLPDKTDKH